MANYVKLSDLPEGTICKLKLADGTLEEYVLAKHDYESELNGAGRVLFISKTSSQFSSTSFNNSSYFMDDSSSWGTSNGSSSLESKINAASFKERFSIVFLGAVSQTKIYYNYVQAGYHFQTMESKTMSTLFFIPSAVELGVTYRNFIDADKSTNLSSDVVNLLSPKDVWTRTLSNTYDSNEEDDGYGETETFYNYSYVVYFDSNGTAKESYSSNQKRYNLCFTLSNEVFVDTDDENKFVFYVYNQPRYSYVSSNGVAQIIDYMFIGVGNTARKVKAAYIGVENIARRWYKSIFKKIVHNVIPQSNNRSLVGGARIGDLAVFAGGANVSDDGRVSGVLNLVESYNKDGTILTATNLPTAVRRLAGTGIGDSGIFGGGETENYKYTTYVYMYDKNLSRTTLTDFPDKKSEHFAASTKDYALFGGGIYKKTQFLAAITEHASKYVYPYNVNGVLQGTINLSSERIECGVAQINDGVIAAGGFDNYNNNDRTGLADVDFISNNLTVTSIGPLSVARGYVAGVSNKSDLACFLGGAVGLQCKTAYSTIDIYDNNFTKTSIDGFGTYYNQIYTAGYIPSETLTTPNGCFIFKSLAAHIYLDSKNGTILADLTNNIEIAHEKWDMSSLHRSQNAITLDDAIIFHSSGICSLCYQPEE